ncbi:hypothetical protein KKE06_00615 [Candidatus Micrarchaeota archaeon]|nr:hypothetical protein [Candidatus Micrarchaeota archaeon]MBU1930305.1 hypothetical protein [Candidatus Micrarchaeota archaeon]
MAITRRIIPGSGRILGSKRQVTRRTITPQQLQARVRAVQKRLAGFQAPLRMESELPRLNPRIAQTPIRMRQLHGFIRKLSIQIGVTQRVALLLDRKSRRLISARRDKEPQVSELAKKLLREKKVPKPSPAEDAIYPLSPEQKAHGMAQDILVPENPAREMVKHGAEYRKLKALIEKINRF